MMRMLASPHGQRAIEPYAGGKGDALWSCTNLIFSTDTGGWSLSLKREHATIIEPARRARAEIFALERTLSDLVNDAYGLSPEEVQLMWQTAPPRMPFTPTGLL